MRGAGVETPEQREEGFLPKTFNAIPQQPGRGSLPCKACTLWMGCLSNAVTESVCPHYGETFLGSDSR